MAKKIFDADKDYWWKEGERLRAEFNHEKPDYKSNPYTSAQPIVEEEPQDEGGFFSWVGKMFGSDDDENTNATMQRIRAGAQKRAGSSVEPLYYRYDNADDFKPERVGAGLVSGDLVMADKNIFRTYKDKYGNRQIESLPIAKLHNDGSIKPAVYSNAAGFDFKLDAQEFDREARLSQADYKAEQAKKAKRGLENMDRPFGTGFNSASGDAASSFVDNLLFKSVTALSNLFGSDSNTHEGDVASNRTYAGQNTAVRDIAGMAGNIAGVIGTGGVLGAGLKGAQAIESLPTLAKGAKYIAETPAAFGALLGGVTSAPENLAEYAKGDASLGGALVKTGIDMAGMGLGFKQGAKASQELRELAEDAGIRSLPFAKRMGTNIAEQVGIGTGQTIGDATMTSLDNASSADARYKAGISDKPRSWTDEVYDAAIGSAGPNVAATLFFEMFGLAGMHGSVGSKVRSFSRDKYNAIKGKLIEAERSKLGITDVANAQDDFLNALPENPRPYTPTEVEDLVRKAKSKGLVDTRMTFEEKQYGQRYSEEERALRAKLTNRHKADPITHTEAILDRLNRGADEDAIISDMKKQDLALLPSDEARERAIIKLVAKDKADVELIAKAYAEAKEAGIPREAIADHLVERGIMPNAEMADLMLSNIDDAISKGYSIDSLKPQYYRDENGNMVYRPTGSAVADVVGKEIAANSGILPSTATGREAGYVERTLGMPMTPEVRSRYGGVNRQATPDGTFNLTPQELSSTGQYVKTLLARPELDKSVKKVLADLYDTDAKRNYSHPSGVAKLVELYNRLEGETGHAVVAVPDMVNSVINKLVGSQPRADFRDDPFKYIKETTHPLATPTWQDKVIADADRMYLYRQFMTYLIDGMALPQAKAAQVLNSVLDIKLKGEGDESRAFAKAIANKSPDAINEAFKKMTNGLSLYQMLGYRDTPTPSAPTNVAEADAVEPIPEQSEVGTAPKVEEPVASEPIADEPRQYAYKEPVVDNTPMEAGVLIGDKNTLTPLERRLLAERKLAVRAAKENFAQPENAGIIPQERIAQPNEIQANQEGLVDWQPVDKLAYDKQTAERPALEAGKSPLELRRSTELARRDANAIPKNEQLAKDYNDAQEKALANSRKRIVDDEPIETTDLYENASELEGNAKKDVPEYKPAKELKVNEDVPELPKLPESIKAKAPVIDEVPSAEDSSSKAEYEPNDNNAEAEVAPDVNVASKDESVTGEWSMLSEKGKKPTPLELAKYKEHLAAIDKPGTEKQVQKHKDWVAKFEQKYQKPVTPEPDYVEPTTAVQEADAVATEDGSIVAPNEVSIKDVKPEEIVEVAQPEKIKVKKTTKKQKAVEEKAQQAKLKEDISRFDDLETNVYADLPHEFNVDEDGTFRGMSVDELIDMPEDKRSAWLEEQGYTDPDMRDDITFGMYDHAKEKLQAKEPLGFYGLPEEKALKLTKKELGKLADKYMSSDINEEYTQWKKDYTARKEAVDIPGNDINADYMKVEDNGDGTVTQTGKGGFAQTKTIQNANEGLSAVLVKLRGKNIVNGKFKVDYDAAHDRYTITKDKAPISKLIEDYESQFQEHLTDDEIAVLENTPMFQKTITSWSWSPKPTKRTEAMLKREAGLQVARASIGALSIMGGLNMDTDDSDYDFIKKFLIAGGAALIASDAYVTVGRKLRDKNIELNRIMPRHKMFAGFWKPKNIESITAKNMAEQKVAATPIGERANVQAAIDRWNKSNADFTSSTFKANRSLAHIKGEQAIKLQRAGAEGQILKDRAIHEVEEMKESTMKLARKIPGVSESDALYAMIKVNDDIYTATTTIWNDPYLSRDMKKNSIKELTTPEKVKARLTELTGVPKAEEAMYEMYSRNREAQDRITYHDVAATLMNYYGIDLRNARKELESLGTLAGEYTDKMTDMRSDITEYRKAFARQPEVRKAVKGGKKLRELLASDAEYSRLKLELETLKGQYSPIKNKIKAIESGVSHINDSKLGHHLIERWAMTREGNNYGLSIYEISEIGDGAKRVHENSSLVNEFHHFDTDDRRAKYTNQWLTEHKYKTVDGYPNVYEVEVIGKDGKPTTTYVQLNDKINFDDNSAVRITNFKQVRRTILKIARDEMDLNVFKQKATVELEKLREQYNVAANHNESMTDIDATMISNIDSLLNLAEGMTDRTTLVKNLNDMFTYVLNPKAKVWQHNKNAKGYEPHPDDKAGYFEMWDKGMAKAMRRFSNTYISGTLTRELEGQLLEANSLGIRNNYTDYLGKLYDDILYQGPTVNYLDDVIKNRGYKFVAGAERAMTTGAIGLNATVPIKNIVSGMATNVAGLISRGFNPTRLSKTSKGFRDAMKGEVTKPIYNDEMLDAIHQSLIDSRVMRGTSIEQLSNMKGHRSKAIGKLENVAFYGMKVTETMNRYMGAMGYAMNAMNDVPIETTGLSKKEYVKMITEDAANFVYETQGNFDFIYRSPIEKMAIRNIPLGKHVLALQSPAINQLNFFANTTKRMFTMPDNRKKEAGAMLGFLALSWFAGGVANVPGLADIMLGYDALNYDKNDKNSQRLVAKMEGVLVDALAKAGMDRRTAATMANIYRKGGISTLLDKDVSMSQSAYEMLTPFMLQKIQSNWDMLAENIKKPTTENFLKFFGRNFVGGGRLVSGMNQLAAGEVLDPSGAPMGRKYGTLDAVKTTLFGDDLNDKIAREDKRLGVRGVRTPQAAREFVRNLLGDGITFDGMKGSEANEAKSELLADKSLEKLAPQLEEQYNKYLTSKLMQGIIERNTRKAEQFIQKNEKLLRQINPGEYVGYNKDYSALKDGISRDVKKFAELLAKQNVANKLAQKYGLGDITLSAYGKYDLGEFTDDGKPLEEYTPSEQPYVYALVQFYKKASRSGALEDEE